MAFHAPDHDHGHCARDVIARAEAVCARRKTRLTDQRRAVLALIAEHHTAVGAYDIMERMAESGERPAPITVYRALDFLLDNGLIHKIESKSAFVACSHDHEGATAAILLCEKCDAVAELDAPKAFAALAAEVKAQRFKPARMVVEITGLCAHCA